jgi:transcriptional regulator with XRE-family HTH domain
MTMGTPRQIAEARRRATRIHRNLGDDVRRLREDAGISRARLAEAAGIDLAFLCRMEEGRERPSIDTYAKVSVALGSDLSSRLYPNTGPAIRDRHQARMLEALLAILDPRWKAYPEVAVRRPSRGWIDVVLHMPSEHRIVATEIQSDLARLEQLLRWFVEKVAALPSWDSWSSLGEVAYVSRLLVVRSTRSTRATGREFERQIAAAYPAHPQDAIASLRGTGLWPGPALIWAELETDRVRFIARR